MQFGSWNVDSNLGACEARAREAEEGDLYPLGNKRGAGGFVRFVEWGRKLPSYSFAVHMILYMLLQF